VRPDRRRMDKGESNPEDPARRTNGVWSQGKRIPEAAPEPRETESGAKENMHSTVLLLRRNQERMIVMAGQGDE